MACFWRRDCHKRNGLSTSLVNVVLRARGRPRLFVRRQTALNRLRRPACLGEEAPKSSHMVGDKDPSHQLRVFAYNAEDAREIAWRKRRSDTGTQQNSYVCLLVCGLRETKRRCAHLALATPQKGFFRTLFRGGFGSLLASGRCSARARFGRFAPSAASASILRASFPHIALKTSRGRRGNCSPCCVGPQTVIASTGMSASSHR